MARLVGNSHSNHEVIEIKPIKKIRKYYTIWKILFESKCTGIKIRRTVEIVTSVHELIKSFEELIKNDDKKIFFESIEPNFELELEKQNDSNEFIVKFWVDLHGLGKKDYHYSYNTTRLGIKYTTNSKNIQNFFEDLKKDSEKLK